MRIDGEMVAAMRSEAEQLTNQLERMTKELSSLQEKLRDISVTAVSRDGLVRVTVGSDGKPTDLSLDPRIYQQPDSARLASTILDTMAVASEEARRRAMEICQPFMPDGALDDYAEGDFTKAMERFRQRMPFMGDADNV